ncbi:MFS transporter [Solirubrobacter ginsenosidimutans]|uniref:MFS transporter n=1 Tax=Solirubrobacter ginsenosidimutans TaxID=490573 RepID=A0A9X3MP82_9ACTN|nr:MFS transporter [Solirubrobacter ginsenosidimutans]MDA0160114.1 MFS transporter [Solirubrobacter ginsenosidimutans]
MTAIAVPRTTQNVLAVAAGAAFLALLDTTVANLAVADVQTDFAGMSVNGATWIITIYAVVFAALLAPAGRVADVVGRRTLLIAGVGGFTAMSLACALAPSLPALLVARALQAAAAAAMIPASLAVVLADTPPERRAAAIGAWSAAGALAAAAGPAIGGVLVDQVGWRALFLINVPVGVLIVLGARQIPAGKGAGHLPDALGTLLLGVGIGAAALGISQGSTWGWGDPKTVAAILGGVLAAAAAIWRSTRHAYPALETRLWRSKRFATANVASLLYGAALFPWMLVGVLVQVTLWDYSPLQAGLGMTPGAIVAAVVAVLASKRPHKPVILVGAATLAAAGAICAFALPATPDFLGFWLPVGVLIGIGMGAVTTGISTAAALSVTPDRFAAAVGLNSAARQVGGALGVAVLAGIVDGDIASFKDVYLFCTLATLGVALAGSRL